jgi:hypothetical protein
VTALPRSGAHDGTPGSVRYLTKEAPRAAAGAAADDAARRKAAQQTVPMARPKQLHHLTEPMAGRPGRFAHASSPDARTPEPQSIDKPRTSRRPSDRTGLLARIAGQIERVVPLKALPFALGLGGLALVAGMFVLRAKGIVDLSSGAKAPMVAPVPPALTPSTSTGSPVMTSSQPASPSSVPVVESAAISDAGGGAVAVVQPVAITSSTPAAAPSTPAAATPKQPLRATPRPTATSSSPAAPPMKKTAKPSDVGFE